MDSLLSRTHQGGFSRAAWAAVLITAAATCLVSCRSASVLGTAAPGVAALPAGGVVYRIDPAASEIHILVYRAGPLSRLGHNHVIAVQDPEGEVLLHSDRLGSSFELLVAVDGLTVDSPLLRERYGEAFASTPTEADIAGTRDNMLGPALLDAAAYPYLRIAGQLVSAPDGDAVALEIAVKDTVVQRTVPISLEIGEDSLTARGTLEIDHSALGLTPFSVMLGALRVAETMEIRFSLTARRAGRRESARDGGL